MGLGPLSMVNWRCCQEIQMEMLNDKVEILECNLESQTTSKILNVLTQQ